MNTILSELTGVFHQLPADALQEAAEIVGQHNRIFVYGAGRSGLMLKAFAMRLAQMGKNVYVVGETVTPALEQGDLLFLASASGSTQSTCRYAKIAADLGADLFLISANENSPLSQIHPIQLLLSTSTKNRASGSAQVMGSLFEQSLLLLCDGIIAALPHSGDAMRRRHANLE